MYFDQVETCAACNASEIATKFASVAIVSCLQQELKFAHRRINELEFDRRSVNEKVDCMLQKFEEEKASWRRREHEKIQNIIASIKNDLSGERKNRQRMEVVNAKLAAELNEANLRAKQNLRDYEREKGARELAEDACDELVKEIGEDKSEIEALKRESVKIREGVEEERRMLQMAEVWREERVKMKLIDANLTLHNKYSELNKLKADLQAFLQVQAAKVTDLEPVKEAHMLKDAVELINVPDMREFSYQPPNSKDIFSIFQELIEETSEEEISQVSECSLASHDSKIHPVSAETEKLEEPISGCTNEGADTIGDTEDDDGWVSVNKVEEQGSSNSLEGSEVLANGLHEHTNALVSGTDWDDDKENDKIFCSSTNNRQSNKKGSSSVDGENLKNRRLPNDEVNSDTIGSSPSNLGQLSSLKLLNPHVTRGMKGFVEWTRGMQRLRLRSKLIEASINSQKIQLPHTTKQKT